MAQLTEEDKKRVVCPNLAMGCYGRRGGYPVFLNPTVDVLWVDCPFESTDIPQEYGWPATRLSGLLRTAGFYDHHLIAVQRLAVEFSDPKHRKVCSRCDTLRSSRKHWEEFRDSWHNRDPSKQRVVCLLCNVLDGPEFTDLSENQKHEVRNLLKLSVVRRSVKWHYTDAPDGGVRVHADLSPERRKRVLETGEVKTSITHHFGRIPDPEGFVRLYPLLARAAEALERAYYEFWDFLDEDDSWDHEDPSTFPLFFRACPRHFGDDLLACFNDSQCYGSIERGFHSENYDASGSPICYANLDAQDQGVDCRDLLHSRRWCSNTEAVASFWPVSTPNLRILYVIDREIKLKPGAQIPAGTTVFQGNGCVYAEVPEPADRALEDGGEDAVWQYPRARPWGATAFDFARYAHEHMKHRQSRLRRHRISIEYDPERLIEELTETHDTDYFRAIHEGKVPECRVLAIVEQN
ncbi:296cef34-597e-49f4-9a39-5d62561e06e0 [Thermothielavioides terrestris]|uniref:296cef34-597e-49f4-9a39-5d62561e06e0 n=1 Tax=Thermothielavioides terrestris TaxID=2587410 RepID=A0A3S5CXG9_9PEZI|nr:296cef34-597e-49f4-9a39-5d62561e06e0 [Thermothielavioides terrestris]